MDNQYRLGQEKKGRAQGAQSQINPHFLYNTLDMILWMAQKDEKENIQEVVLCSVRLLQADPEQRRGFCTLDR